MEVRLLGPLDVSNDRGRSIRVTSGKQRVVLAALAVHPGHVVSAEDLIDCLWGENPPLTARDTVHSHVMRLRRTLADSGLATALTTRPPGYLLELAPEHVDLHQVTRLRGRAAEAQQRGDLADAAALLTEALTRWRGPILADVDSAVLRERHAAAWEEIQLQTLADRIAVRLSLGFHAEHIGELRSLVAAHPLREHFRGQLMVALHGSGQQAEALREFQRARRELADELGVEPGPYLREIHQLLLGGGDREQMLPATRLSSAAEPTAPAQLPHTVWGFVGRRAELARLDGLLGRAAGSPAMTIAMIEGMGGIGKTATALRWAHRNRSVFPHGQLYLDLRGFDPTGDPMDPTEALSHLLRSLGVPAESVPDGVEARSHQLRSLLSDRQVLLVLDNAHSAEQVRPLLPGTPDSFVIITTRARMGSLIARDHAVPIRLGPLDAADSLSLLAGQLGADWLSRQGQAARELADWCGHVPLALSIIAARVLETPDVSLEQLLAHLRARQRLDGFDTADGPDSNLRAVYSWSYLALSNVAARLFSQLARHPGPSVSAAAAAAIAGLPQPQTQVLLAELTRAHLLERSAPDRYVFHDLLHAYACEQPMEPDSGAASRRMLDFYVHSAVNADTTLRPHRVPVPVEPADPAVSALRFDDYQAALTWCQTEQANLVAAVRAAHAEELHGHAWRLALALWSFHYITKRRSDWLLTSEIGLRCARAAGDEKAEGALLASLGTALCESQRYDEAIERYTSALAKHRSAGDRAREPGTLNSLAVAHAETGQFASALDAFDSARDVYADVGNLQGEGLALTNMALCHLRLGQVDEAAIHNEKALTVYRELGDRYCEAICLSNLGEVHAQRQEHRSAVDLYTEAVTAHLEAGNRHGMGRTLLSLGHSQAALKQCEAARGSWRAALAVFEELGEPEAEETRKLLAEPSVDLDRNTAGR